MNNDNQEKSRSILGILIGLFAALFSCVIVIGGFLLALSEGGVRLSLPATATTIIETTSTLSPTGTSVATITPHSTESTPPTATSAAPSPAPSFTATAETQITSSPAPSFTSTAAPTIHPSATQTLPPPPTLGPTVPPLPPAGCGPSASWVIYLVKSGDTLYSLSLAYGLTVDQLIFANCLTSTTIQVGQQLWVPNVVPQLPTPTITTGPVVTNTPAVPTTPPPTNTPPPPTTPLPTNTLPPPTIPTQPPPGSGCGPSASWVIYIVNPGDTVYNISTAYSITVEQLMYANCLTSTAIYTGQALWVPNITPNFPNSPNIIAPAPTDTQPPPTSSLPQSTNPPKPASIVTNTVILPMV